MHIAIDGPSGAGKSTIAKALAKRLNLVYLDTGAMYRAVGYKALSLGICLHDGQALEEMLNQTSLVIERIGQEQHVLLDGCDITSKIRSPEVSMAASTVSAAGQVRRKLVAMQQEMAKDIDVVMDGRDIGTAVLPGAQYKFFLTASDEVRAKRRHEELLQKGEKVSYKTVLADIQKRDLQDSTREESPLRCATDATVVDTSDLGIDDVVVTILALMGRYQFA